MKIPKNLQKLVEEVIDERNDDNGYWVYLMPGYINTSTEVHMVHEDTVTEVLYQLRYCVKRCECDECKGIIEKRNTEIDIISDVVRP